MADFVMLLHFGLALFITLGFFFIPFGCKFGWSWTQLWRLRILHLVMMGIVTAEAIVGLTCPLTVLENLLRGVDESQTFVFYWVGRVLYWDLPRQTFILFYSLCLAWVILMWKYCPPKKRGGGGVY